MKIRLTKVSATPDAVCSAADWGKYAPGTEQGFPVGYSVEGWLGRPIEFGVPVLLWRTVRNGIASDGIFRSSAVREILLVTQNSVYCVEPAPAASEPAPQSDSK